MSITGNAGTDWGGEYSRWNFDEGKAYLMVAKMMLEPSTSNPIPLLDAELNENSEILIQLIRRAIKRIYGNGTTGQGFKIIQSGTNINNNFTITGGDGTPAGAGAIFVEGWQPINLSNVEYTAQTYGPVALTTPSSNRVDEVYIDVFYEEIGKNEDGDIVDPTINLETSRRIKLVWEVKVAEGGTTPADYVDANNVKHYTLKLAELSRLSGDATITTAMITDARNDERLISLNSELSTHEAPTATAHGATSEATASTLMARDSLGRVKIAAPGSSDQAAQKAQVDTVQSNLNTHTSSSNVHNATSEATNGRIVMRDTDGRIKIAGAVDNAQAINYGQANGRYSISGADGSGGNVVILTNATTVIDPALHSGKLISFNLTSTLTLSVPNSAGLNCIFLTSNYAVTYAPTGATSFYAPDGTTLSSYTVAANELGPIFYQNNGKLFIVPRNRPIVKDPVEDTETVNKRYLNTINNNRYSTVVNTATPFPGATSGTINFPKKGVYQVLIFGQGPYGGDYLTISLNGGAEIVLFDVTGENTIDGCFPFSAPLEFYVDTDNTDISWAVGPSSDTWHLNHYSILWVRETETV